MEGEAIRGNLPYAKIYQIKKKTISEKLKGGLR